MASPGESRWVLIPGTLCTERVFFPLLDELEVEKSACKIMVPDEPNVGDYDTRLRKSVTGGEIVCGFSLGALILAHNLGALNRARAVVLLASNPFPDPPGNRTNREALRDKIMAGGARDWVMQNWAAMSASNRDDLRDFVARMAEETAHLIPAQTELAASRPGAETELTNTNLPIILVTGSEDRLTPPARLQEIAKRSRTGNLTILEGLGHYALIEAPDRVAKAIRDGLAALRSNTHIKRPDHETRKHPDIPS